MNPLIFICLIGAALGMAPQKVEVQVLRNIPSGFKSGYNPFEVLPGVPGDQNNPFVYKPVYTGEGHPGGVPVVQSTPSVYKPVYTGEVYPGTPGGQSSPSVYKPVYHPAVHHGVSTHGPTSYTPYKVIGTPTHFFPYVFIPTSTVEGGNIGYNPYTSQKSDVDTSPVDCILWFCR